MGDRIALVNILPCHQKTCCVVCSMFASSRLPCLAETRTESSIIREVSEQMTSRRQVDTFSHTDMQGSQHQSMCSSQLSVSPVLTGPFIAYTTTFTCFWVTQQCGFAVDVISQSSGLRISQAVVLQSSFEVCIPTRRQSISATFMLGVGYCRLRVWQICNNHFCNNLFGCFQTQRPLHTVWLCLVCFPADGCQISGF